MIQSEYACVCSFQEAIEEQKKRLEKKGLDGILETPLTTTKLIAADERGHFKVVDGTPCSEEMILYDIENHASINSNYDPILVCLDDVHGQEFLYGIAQEKTPFVMSWPRAKELYDGFRRGMLHRRNKPYHEVFADKPDYELPVYSEEELEQITHTPLGKAIDIQDDRCLFMKLFDYSLYEMNLYKEALSKTRDGHLLSPIFDWPSPRPGLFAVRIKYAMHGDSVNTFSLRSLNHEATYEAVFGPQPKKLRPTKNAS